MLAARCEARAGDTSSALAKLGQAIDLGFRALDILDEADEFAAVLADPGFAELERRAAEAQEKEKEDEKKEERPTVASAPSGA
jgi:hypothetical protein